MRLIDPDYKRLAYGNYKKLAVEKTIDGWIWTELDSHYKKLRTSKKEFSTFFEAVKDFELILGEGWHHHL